MNSPSENTQPQTSEEKVHQSVEETQEPEETTDRETLDDEPGSNDEDKSDEDQLPSADEDFDDESDDEDDADSDPAEERRFDHLRARRDGSRRFVRSRAPSPEDPALRSDDPHHRRSASENDIADLGRRVEGVSSLDVRSSPPLSSPAPEAAMNRLQVTPNPIPGDLDAAPPGSSTDADSDLERTDG